MSITLSLYCHDCRERYYHAGGSKSEWAPGLAWEFLFRHMSHSIEANQFPSSEKFECQDNRLCNEPQSHCIGDCYTEFRPYDEFLPEQNECVEKMSDGAKIAYLQGKIRSLERGVNKESLLVTMDSLKKDIELKRVKNRFEAMKRLLVPYLISVVEHDFECESEIKINSKPLHEAIAILDKEAKP